MDTFNYNYWQLITVFTVVFFFSIFLLYLYRKYTIKSNSFIAIPVSRSSHNISTPTGAGFIVAITYLVITLALLVIFDFQHTEKITYFYIGALFSTIYGFYDDLSDRGTLPKLIVQIILAGWLIFLFNEYLNYVMPFEAMIYRVITMFLLWFFLVWFSNAINFMDGIDGMLASGSLLILLSSSILMVLVNIQSVNAFFLSILIPILLGFLYFNFSKSKLFLGDSGSLFLAYFLSFFVLETLSQQELNIWAWIILFSHFLTETTLTTMLRIFLTKDWYKPHKSHAYQNLARILDDHKKVTLSSIFFHILWLLPLAYGAILMPNLGFALFLLASFPVIIITLLYGPLYSKD